jgi:hypothetical protein
MTDARNHNRNDTMMSDSCVSARSEGTAKRDGSGLVHQCLQPAHPLALLRAPNTRSSSRSVRRLGTGRCVAGVLGRRRAGVPLQQAHFKSEKSATSLNTSRYSHCTSHLHQQHAWNGTVRGQHKATIGDQLPHQQHGKEYFVGKCDQRGPASAPWSYNGKKNYLYQVGTPCAPVKLVE